MAKQKSRKKARTKRKAAKRSKKNRVSSRFKWLLLLFVCLGLTIYTLFLDHRIRSEFEGNRWSLPARVYAQETELYLGQRFSIAEIEKYIRLIGYVKSNYLNHPGRYKILSSNTIRISTRDFKFWDGLELQRSLKISTANGAISEILDLESNVTLPIVRFEPQLIGKIYPEHNEDRVLVALEDTPEDLINGLLAIEDRNFYKHFGIDPKGIARAMWINLRHGEFRQGGSTLTQQLVKNYFLTHEKTLRRKFNEFIMALLLEYHYSKQDILSAYLNEVYLGQNGARAIHGFGTASEFYFSKPLRELNTSEVALLAGMVKGASYYNPRRHPKRAIARRNLVLDEMFKQDYLSNKNVGIEKKRWLGVKQKPDWDNSQYTAFLDLLKVQLFDFYTEEQLRTEGLRIFTTMVPHYQTLAQSAVSKRLSQLEKNYNLSKQSLQSGLIVSTTDTGEILAVVGGRDSKQTGFNRALEAKRPIGSLIKPAVYLTALNSSKKYTVLTLLNDSPIEIKQTDGSVWQPKNYDKKMRGPVPVYEALAKSYNLATINLGLEIGLIPVIKTLNKLAIDKHIPEYPSLLLGALDLSVLEVMQMYQTLASSGFQVPLNSVRAIMDKNGELLQRKRINISQSLDDKAVFITQSLLTNVFRQGTAAALQNRFASALPLAGKTGTTNDLRDSWFAGYGSNLLSVVWVGRDDNQSAKLTGSQGAMQVWADVMSQLPLENLNLKAPGGIVMKQIKTRENDCREQLRFPFVEKTIPSSANFCD